MKLLTKLNTRYISYSLSVMVVSGILIYLVISGIVNKQIDEKLADISTRISQKISEGGKVDWLQPFAEVTETKTFRESSAFTDTLILNRAENEQEAYRQLTVVKKINETQYKIVVRESKIESEDLIESLAGITLLAIFFLTGSLIVVNRRIARSIWSPFYKNLKAIEGFSLHGHSPILLDQTGITEFDALNDVVSKLTGQIIADFQNLKQFSEDASHEIQTPLSILSAKLESLLNEAELNEKQLKIVQSAHLSVQRISKLNKELLLLTKIENNQFPSVEKLSPEKIIHEKLDEFQELLELKGISVENRTTGGFEIEGNLVLTDLLISNLISNAINHNIPGGLIRIEMNSGSLVIQNTGRSEIVHPEKLFARFYKENSSSNSVGLGLAIVQKICEVQGWKVSYSFIKPLHGFHVLFEI